MPPPPGDYEFEEAIGGPADEEVTGGNVSECLSGVGPIAVHGPHLGQIHQFGF